MAEPKLYKDLLTFVVPYYSPRQIGIYIEIFYAAFIQPLWPLQNDFVQKGEMKNLEGNCCFFF